MGKLKDLTGEKFGRLKVISLSHQDEKGNTVWLCQCDCGNTELKLVKGTYLQRGDTKSCGCLRTEHLLRIGATTYDYNKNKNVPLDSPYRKKLHVVWKGMQHRCYSETNKHYKWYGAKGIIISDEWLNREIGFMNFYNWSIENGYDENLTIDRNDSNGNYEPDNCTWATIKEQENNKGTNILITYKNRTLTAPQWQEEYNNTIDSRIIRERWNKGIRGKKLFEPIKFLTREVIEIDGFIKSIRLCLITVLIT